MNNTKPMEELEHEHHIIEPVVAAMVVLAEQCSQGRKLKLKFGTTSWNFYKSSLLFASRLRRCWLGS